MVPDAEAAARLAGILRYHELSKHHPQRYADGPGWLDWANQPDPFLRWRGTELLPLDRPDADVQASAGGPGYRASLSEGRIPPQPLGRASISTLFWASLAISAWKQFGDARWALRVDPSSGNLHPTEATLLTGPVPGLVEHAAVLHYAPREHALELRARIPPALWQGLSRDLPAGAFLLALSSIPWRESWKYGSRAWRYCQHDCGHALAAVSIAAAGLGWSARVMDALSGPELARLLGLEEPQYRHGPEAEEADLVLLIAPATPNQAGRTPPAPERLSALAIEAFRSLDWIGRPSDLSAEHVEWRALELAAHSAEKPETSGAYAAETERIEPPPDLTAAIQVDRAAAPADDPPLWRLVRQRRSAVDMDGLTGMSLDTFHRTLQACLPAHNRVPFAALPWKPRVHLVLFVHRVESLLPGLYLLHRDPAALEHLKRAFRPDFEWIHPDPLPPDLPLHRLATRDLRSTAAAIACNQAIAANGAFAASMLAEFEPALTKHGAWLYPRLFWETGALGQILYLEAEAANLRATGIGCFFDDELHHLLGLKDRHYQSLYHFTTGTPIDDPRLTTLPAYPSPQD